MSMHIINCCNIIFFSQFGFKACRPGSGGDSGVSSGGSGRGDSRGTSLSGATPLRGDGFGNCRRRLDLS